MFKILKWTVIGCIGLFAVNAFTDGRLVREARVTIEKLTPDEQKSLQNKLDEARKCLQSSDKEIMGTYKELTRSRSDLTRLEDEIAELSLHQKQLYERADYLGKRLATEQASYREILGTYTRNELVEHQRAAWHELEINEAVLDQKKALAVAQQAKVRSQEKLYAELQDRKQKIELELVNLRTKLVMLASDPRWSHAPGANAKNLDKADKIVRDIDDMIKVREEEMRLQGAHFSTSRQLIGPEAESFRAGMAEKYGKDGKDDA